LEDVEKVNVEKSKIMHLKNVVEKMTGETFCYLEKNCILPFGE